MTNAEHQATWRARNIRVARERTRTVMLRLRARRRAERPPAVAEPLLELARRAIAAGDYQRARRLHAVAMAAVITYLEASP